MKIYVRPRKITRKGKRIDGWQAGFCSRGGGVTSASREDAIQHCRDIIRRYFPEEAEAEVAGFRRGWVAGADYEKRGKDRFRGKVAPDAAKVP